jgi:hypothetical protein
MGGNINISGQAGANPAGGSGQQVNIRDLPVAMQQAYQLLQQPGPHPFVVQVTTAIPNFRQLPLHMQLQRMVQYNQHVRCIFFCISGLTADEHSRL